jgi:hypothetical protein
MGVRFYEKPSEFWVDLQLFHERLVACLDASLFLDHKGCMGIPTLSFPSEAKTL